MRTFEFPSKSSPDAKPHRTTRHSDGSVACSCKGSFHPKGCWHMKEVKKQYPFSDERWMEALMLVRSGMHQTLLRLIIEHYPTVTREETAKLIHTICEWVCPLCGTSGQAPHGIGCTACSEGE